MFDTHQCSKYESSRGKILKSKEATVGWRLPQPTAASLIKRKDRHVLQDPPDRQDPQDKIFSRG